MYEPDNESRGTLALVLGILSLVTGCLLGIPAWLVANTVMREVPWDHPQYQYAKIGKICGIISLVLSVAGTALVLIVWLGFGALFAFGAAAIPR
jgi:hypothetical protein